MLDCFSSYDFQIFLLLWIYLIMNLGISCLKPSQISSQMRYFPVVAWNQLAYKMCWVKFVMSSWNMLKYVIQHQMHKNLKENHLFMYATLILVVLRKITLEGNYRLSCYPWIRTHYEINHFWKQVNGRAYIFMIYNVINHEGIINNLCSIFKLHRKPFARLLIQ